MFAADEKIDTIDDRYWQVRAEPVPQEEMDPPQSTRRIHAYHVNPDATNNVRVALLLWHSLLADMHHCPGQTGVMNT